MDASYLILAPSMKGFIKLLGYWKYDSFRPTKPFIAFWLFFAANGLLAN